jgi:translocation and assembly module TamA
MSDRSVVARLTTGVLLAASLALGGCAGLQSFFSAAAAMPADPAASAPAVASERADYQFEVEAPDALRALLSTYLDLARFQNAPATEGITQAELERLMKAAPAQARSLLETAGYFNAEVTVGPAGTTPGSAGGKPVIRMQVQPGPRARVGSFKLDATGDFDHAVQAGDPAAVREIESLRRLWPLAPGQPFDQPAWAAAKNTALARLRAEGYPAAAWSATEARVDAQADKVDLSLVLQSGPLYRLGTIEVEGISRYDADAVRKLSTFSPGTPYNEQLLLDFQERLQKLGLFEGATVELDAAPDTSQAAPVRVRVKELPLQQATVGLGYSANTGPRASLEHFHRRVFGSDWVAQNKFEYGPDLKSWEGELTSYPLDGLYRNLVSGSAQRLRSTDELQTSWNARAGRTQDTPRIERLYYAEVAHARVDTPSYITSGDAVSGNYNWVWRDVDSILLPTRGLTVSAQAALGFSRGRQTLTDSEALTEDRGPFARTYGRLTWYRPLGSWYSTWRIEAGQVFTQAAIGVPDTLLFRAGGDDSVRGYSYRSLGPLVDGVVGSGRSLLTGSAEVAHQISPRYPAILWAAFVDAGDAANSWRDLHPAVGYGVGLRWRSPVGPLRVDLAYGQQLQQFRVHFSVGVAF